MERKLLHDLHSLQIVRPAFNRNFTFCGHREGPYGLRRTEGLARQCFQFGDLA